MKQDNPYEMALSFQRGEKEGFEYFFNQLMASLLYFAFRIIQDRPIAEDVVSESFIKLWNRHDQFKIGHPKIIKSWLYTTVKNECLNRVLQGQRKYSRLEKYEQHNAEQVQQSIEEHLIRAEVVRQIHEAMEVLPPVCHKIFQLMYIHGMTAKQVSKELGLSLSTVKNQKARGLGIIRKKCPDLDKFCFS